jgi:hypothetical protein
VPLLTFERQEEYYSHLVFRLYITGQCPVNMNTVAPKIAALQTHAIIQNDDFLKNISNDFDYIAVLYGDHQAKIA